MENNKHHDFPALDNRWYELKEPIEKLYQSFREISELLYNSKSKHIVAIKSSGGFGMNIMTPFVKRRLERGDKVLIITQALNIYPRAKDLSVIFQREENPIIKDNITIIGYRRFILDKYKDAINQDFDLAVFDNFNNGKTSQMYKKVVAFDGAKQILKIRGAGVDDNPTGIYTSDNPILK